MGPDSVGVYDGFTSVPNQGPISGNHRIYLRYYKPTSTSPSTSISISIAALKEPYLYPPQGLGF